MNVRRDRGVALPSPVAAISVAAIVVAAVAFAVTGLGGGNGNKDVTPTTTARVSTSSPTATISDSASSTPSATPTAPPTFDKAKLHVSVFNAGSVKGLAATTADKAKAAGWTDIATGPLHGGYSRNVIYYPSRLSDPAQNAMWKAAAEQLGLDLGIPAEAITAGDTATRQDRLTVVMLTPLS